MLIDILTVFPEFIQAGTDYSIVKRAREKNALEVRVHNLRDYTHDKHRSTDDAPFGPGVGMVMKPEPIFEAVETILGRDSEIPTQQDIARADLQSGPLRQPKVMLLTPQGEPFSQKMAGELSQESHLIMICGHYEGVDERVREHLVDREISIGDYVLTGGELPALVVLDAVTRLLPGVLGDEESAVEESFSEDLLEYPHYTRPAEFRGWKVPDILLSGHHAEIAKWRRMKAIERTLKKRPDLLERAELTKEDKEILQRLREEQRCEEDFDAGD